MTVFVIQHETTVGPIFSTKEKAIAHLECNDLGEKYKYTENNPYETIHEVTVDDGKWMVDG